MSTPQHHIIKETSDTFSKLLAAEFKGAGYKRVHIVDEAPKPDTIEGKLPAVSMYLYQVSLDPVQKYGGVLWENFEEEDDDGNVQEYKRRQILWVRLDYLVSTWAQTPEDEQLLMGLIIRAVLDNPSLEESQMRGESFGDHRLFLDWCPRLDEGTMARFWGSLSQPIRPAIQVFTVIPIRPDRRKRVYRVHERSLNFRDINSPSVQESGPAREVLSRSDFDPT
jgi:hypothetical protein